MQKNIKLVVLDLDGTLLQSPKKVHPDNVMAVRKLIKNGYRVLIATGADLTRVTKILNQLDIPHHDLYCIAVNGGIIYNFETQKAIHKFYLSAKDTKKFFEIGNKHHVQIVGTPVENSAFHYNGDKKGIFSIFQRVYLGYSFKKIDLANPQPIYKALVGGKWSRQKAFLQEIQENIKFSYVISYVHNNFYPFLEINAEGVNKKFALEWLANKWDIKPAEIMAIGDGNNDEEMLKYVGLSVAMGNARPQLKQIAKEITDTNYNGGVAKAINRLIFQEEN